MPYLSSQQCASMYPVVYYDSLQQTNKANKYLILHEVHSRDQNNYRIDGQWNLYKGIITWNPVLYEEYSNRFNMVFCSQYMNIYPERIENYVDFQSRGRDVCCFYGPPASIDFPIMNARYDVPLALHDAGMSVDAYGVIPNTSRPEYRPRWKEIFKGSIPAHHKRDGMIKYKFSIPFENSRDPRWASGYVTEKIYDCLGSGTIPIYWGAPNITDYVPPEVFVDYRNFETTQDLHRYLTTTPDSTFQKMSQEGLEFWDTVRFDEYLDTFERLKNE